MEKLTKEYLQGLVRSNFRSKVSDIRVALVQAADECMVSTYCYHLGDEYADNDLFWDALKEQITVPFQYNKFTKKIEFTWKD